MSAFHIAQLNIGRARGPVDGPVMADFMALLDPINTVADASPGFVWRLQTEEGNATALRPYEDDRMIVNMSVWESIEALAGFVYRSGHVDVMRRRREWFEPMKPYMVLWWVPEGTLPTVEEAKDRLAHLRDHGPTPFAFTFKASFPSPQADAEVVVDDDLRCPASRRRADSSSRLPPPVRRRAWTATVDSPASASRRCSPPSRCRASPSAPSRR